MSKTTKTRTYPMTPAGLMGAVVQARKQGEKSITIKLKRSSPEKPQAERKKRG